MSLPPPFLISANLPPPPTLDFVGAQDLLTSNGATLMVLSVDWPSIEQSPKTYDLINTILNPFALFGSRYDFKGVVLVLKMIDSNVRTVPADLVRKAFGDSTLQQRWLAMLHAVATAPGVAQRLNYVLLGNEVDSYFDAHPSELNGFMTLMQKSVAQLHRDVPGIQVGTITRFESLANANLFRTLTQYSDFVDFTYYALGPNWQQRPVSDAVVDLSHMADAAANVGNKRFGFTEIGYSTSATAGSSEQQQMDFMSIVFQTLTPRRDQVAFINWASLGDSPLDTCLAYAAKQGVPNPDVFCSCACSTGLLTLDGQPRLAWNLFVQQMSSARQALTK